MKYDDVGTCEQVCKVKKEEEEEVDEKEDLYRWVLVGEDGGKKGKSFVQWVSEPCKKSLYNYILY